MEIKDTGMVHLYVGDGKGKTTAAVGLAVRAWGQGQKVLFCQFLKGGDSGEIKGLQALRVEVLHARHNGKFLFQMNGDEVDSAQICNQACFLEARERIFSGEIHLAILDEVIDAVGAGMVEPEQLVELITARPREVELVLTGHRADTIVRLLADYHTNFDCVAHPYECGVTARVGIEY